MVTKTVLAKPKQQIHSGGSIYAGMWRSCKRQHKKAPIERFLLATARAAANYELEAFCLQKCFRRSKKRGC